MEFWIIALALTGVTVGLLSVPLWRARDVADEGRTDIAVYRDQLAEVDRDLARGVLAPDEAERVRVEVSRRLLAADKAGTRAIGAAPVGVSRGVAAAVVLVLLAGSAGVYWIVGAPGYGDMPMAERIAQGDQMRADRPSQAAAEAAAPPAPAATNADPAYLEMVDKLRKVVPTRPDDPQGWHLLARNEANLGNYIAARKAQDHLVALRGDAVSIEELTFQADLMVAAAAGIVTPEAEHVVRQILARDQNNLAGRYYLGLLYAQTDRPDLAFRLWKPVAESSDTTDPHVQFARGQIEAAAQLAGADYTMPPAPDAQQLPGPSAADVAGAAQMSDADRQAMIRNMVAGLADRLATQGGTAQEWARLIGAYGVLGETEKAKAIWDEAQQTFADQPDGLAVIRAAAEQAGVTG